MRLSYCRVFTVHAVVHVRGSCLVRVTNITTQPYDYGNLQEHLYTKPVDTKT
jgi:hypothetical protein